LFAKFTSQPSHGSMSQVARNVSHVGTQTPLVQVFAVVPVGVSQIRPQTPQFCSSVCMFTQTELQNVCPDGHWQTLFTQLRPPVQTVPHAPQLVLSVAVLTHVSSHTVSPLLQPHMPLIQGRPPVHPMLQPPQCETLFEMLISQPFGPCVSQLAWAPSQAGVQLPETH
jgi:hypothetical protein